MSFNRWGSDPSSILFFLLKHLFFPVEIWNDVIQNGGILVYVRGAKEEGVSDFPLQEGEGKFSNHSEDVCW